MWVWGVLLVGVESQREGGVRSARRLQGVAAHSILWWGNSPFAGPGSLLYILVPFHSHRRSSRKTKTHPRCHCWEKWVAYVVLCVLCVVCCVLCVVCCVLCCMCCVLPLRPYTLAAFLPHNSCLGSSPLQVGKQYKPWVSWIACFDYFKERFK